MIKEICINPKYIDKFIGYGLWSLLSIDFIVLLFFINYKKRFVKFKWCDE